MVRDTTNKFLATGGKNGLEACRHIPCSGFTLKLVFGRRKSNRILFLFEFINRNPERAVWELTPSF